MKAVLALWMTTSILCMPAFGASISCAGRDAQPILYHVSQLDSTAISNEAHDVFDEMLGLLNRDVDYDDRCSVEILTTTKTLLLRAACIQKVLAKRYDMSAVDKTPAYQKMSTTIDQLIQIRFDLNGHNSPMVSQGGCRPHEKNYVDILSENRHWIKLTRAVSQLKF